MFEANAIRKLGNGVRTCFWTNGWLGEVSLCVRYRRLFELAVDRGISVADMRELGWGGLEVVSSSVGVGGGVGWECLFLLSHGTCWLIQLICGSGSDTWTRVVLTMFVVCISFSLVIRFSSHM